MDLTVSHILEHFPLDLPLEVSTVDSGLVNQTYLVKADNGSYILQRLNKVFENVEGIAKNIQLVNEALRGIPDYAIPDIVPTLEGQLFYRDLDKGHWRLTSHIEDTSTINQTNEVSIAFEVGRILGIFHTEARNVDIDQLQVTLPRFHDLDHRLNLLHEAKANCTDSHLLTKSEVYFDNLVQIADDFNRLKSLNIPARATHNDPKLNNVLFNQKTMKAMCLIDLDTIMPGYLMHDFGDAIRTLCNTVNEDLGVDDEPDFDVDLFAGFSKGYFTQTAKWLEQAEWESILESLHLMPTIMGVRFLTDYLNGNTYYKVEHAEQNLDRCKNQLAFVRKIQDKREQVVNTITSFR